MNLSQLRAFNAVAREGSFTRAAERLSISQPAVTAHIKALEESYETGLFRRGSKGVELTEAGVDLAVLTRQIFALELEASELLSATRALTRGNLRIAAGSPYFIVPILAAFQKKFPAVHIDLKIGNSRKVTADLLGERVDVAMQTGWEENPLVEALPFNTHNVVVFCQRDHPFAMAGKKTLKLTELVGERMIWREPQSLTRQVFEAACKKARVSITPVMEVESRETLLEVVAAGLGLGIVSSHELPADNRIQVFDVEESQLETTEYMLTLKRRRHLRVVKEFHKVAEEFCQRICR
ncbi:LysR substrate-binding domain-containing protein [Kiloniella laminariae]|uniref:LysR substrate-binding domain-containing protein n=1 Tax=Kiloniella laminariae TaxID=454162 RepID=A0ABT4LII2_9PROT|nr:LysR substrate-binding domain-containing protein [Kiloniella laminariae]MCZ4280910.1 LysR substrate-binding domain-containing protein [Kiloniella laminariae]